MLKAVIFDMDGVIIDSEPLHTRAAISVLKSVGIDFTEDECNTFIGSTDRYMFEVLKVKYHISASIEDLMSANKKAKKDLLATEGYPAVPFIKDLIKDLHANNIKLAIASSSHMEDIINTSKSLELTSYFNEYVSGMEVDNPKPAPDIFLKACERLGVSPSEAVVIEDSFNGVTAAKAAEITCIGFINPNSGNQDLSKANILIEGFDEIDYNFVNNTYLRSKGEPITIATTQRLIIRELSVNDIKNMYQIYQNPEIKEFIDDIDDYYAIEVEKHKAYIKNMYEFFGYGYWGIFSQNDNSLIGRCGIQNNMIDGNLEIELGYLLDVKHWGYGYAIECSKCVLEYAFYHLGIKRIVAVIDKQNIRSIKVATHLGMIVEKELIYKNRECYLFVITH